MKPSAENDLLYLTQTGVLSAGSKCYEAFEFLLNGLRLNTHAQASAMVGALWTKYEQFDKQSNSLNGAVFEAILASVFLRHAISPIFVQANVVFVPNVNFDFILYSGEFGPISISAKTSLRERYKQADLEAVSLKYVHRKAKCFLVTLHAEEAHNLNKKIQNGDMLGIDEVILADSSAFDGLIERLKRMQFSQPAPVEVICSAKVLLHASH